MITALVIISSIAIGLKKNIDKYIIIIINAYQIHIKCIYICMVCMSKYTNYKNIEYR